MRWIAKVLVACALLAMGALGFTVSATAHGSGEDGTEAGGTHLEAPGAMHHMGGGTMPGSLEEMREMHKGHEHGHDFEAMERMSPEQRAIVFSLMQDIGVVMPPMDPERGRHVFVEKGCIACHSVNGIGGNLGPELNADDMPRPMNAFEFAARMWRGAEAMTALQEDLMGEVILLDGQDLADLVAFAHDEAEQAKLTEDQIPERFHGIIGE
ncbi:MAG: c-type cytochrome [Paracoccaceae bacterium]